MRRSSTDCRGSLPIAGGECLRLAVAQVAPQLRPDHCAVDDEVATDHPKAGGEPWVADGPESIEILLAVDGNTIREAPAVALSDGGAHLVHRGEAPLVRGAEVAEEFARELLPVIIQEVLDRAGHRTMVIGRGKEEGVGPRD